MVIEGLTLETVQGRERVLALAEIPRFDYCDMINKTRGWRIEVFFFQGYDDYFAQDPRPDGYVPTTGVIYGGAVGPMSSKRVRVQTSINCLANRVGCSANAIHNATGKEVPIHFQDAVVPQGKYLKGVGFSIVEKSNADGSLSLHGLDSAFELEAKVIE